MSMKTTLKDIRALAKCKAIATDLTNMSDVEIARVYEVERDFYGIAHSIGVYGINGKVVQGQTTKRLYTIVGRCQTLFYI